MVAVLARSGLGIGTGGAVGADLFALAALCDLLDPVPSSRSAPNSLSPSLRARVRASSPLALAWRSVADLPAPVRPVVRRFESLGGRVHFGPAYRGADFASVVRPALLGRSRFLGTNGRCVAAVAFLGPGRSAGSAFSLSLVGRRLPVFAFVAPGAVLPPLAGGGRWLPARLCGLPCYRWVPKPFVVPE